jgi:hypothetical protein
MYKPCFGLRVINHVYFWNNIKQTYKKRIENHVKINKESIVENMAIRVQFLLTYF